MPLSTEDLSAIGSLIDTKLTAHKSDMETKLSAISKKLEEGDGIDPKKDEEADKKKEEESKAAMAEIASKAALAAVDAAFPKAQRETFAKLSNPDGKSKFDQLVDAQMAVGAPSRGVAVLRVARDHKAEYNAHMAALNGTQTGTL